MGGAPYTRAQTSVAASGGATSTPDSPPSAGSEEPARGVHDQPPGDGGAGPRSDGGDGASSSDPADPDLSAPTSGSAAAPESPAPDEPAAPESAAPEPAAPDEPAAPEPPERDDPAAPEPAALDEPVATGPAATGPARRRRGPLWAKLLVGFGVVITILASGTLVAAKVLVHRYDSAVHKETLLDPGARAKAGNDQPRATVHGPLNYLLLGSDARADNPSLGQRSDTIIVLHIPASMDRAYLISIPRDLRVAIPPLPDTGFLGSTEKVNAAFAYGSANGGGESGGVRLLSATLTGLLGIRFDGAVIVDFSGFQKAVGLLGGIDLCVDHETHSIHTGAVYHVGCQYMRPWQALDYVRQREDQPNGDYDRQRHEQQFLKAIFQRAVAQGVAGNPLKLDAIIQAVGQSLTVDTSGVPLDELVFSLRNVSPNNLVGVRVPSHPTMIGGTSYVLPDDRAVSLYQAIGDDTLDTWIAANGDWVNTI